MSSVASRNVDLKRPRRLLSRPRRPPCTWPPETLGRPVFVSFVSKAVLWERPVSCRTTRVSPQRPSALCPRFLSHMNSDCQGLRPPCFLSSKPRPQPPSAGRQPAARPCRAPSGLPHIPPIPPSSAIRKPDSLHADPARPQSSAGDIHSGLVPKGGKRASQQVEGPDPGEPHWEVCLRPTGSEHSEAAPSSDFSRPSSSLFSRSVDLASGRSSVLLDTRLGSFSLASPNLPKGSGHRNHRSSPFDSGPPGSPSIVRRRSIEPEDTFHRPVDASREVNSPLDSLHSSSLMSPRLGARWTPSADPRRWPVLPPISSLNGRCCRSTAAASLDSNPEFSRTPSGLFDELDAVAPSSPPSRSSLDRAGDLSSSGASPLHETRLCAGLAALSVGRHSGDLSSLSRVQLLLLRRTTPASSPENPERILPAAWSPRRDVTLTSAGPMRTPDSARKVPEDGKSDWSVGGSRSPSSRLINQSPSPDCFPSRSSPEQGSDVGLAGVWEQTEAFPGELADVGAEEKDWSVEQRKRKVLNMLYRLQDPSGQTPGNAHVCSDFDDFDFLAKYCIFSPEKLEEYKKAFEAEDSDADGYISCIQVVDALKRIIPAEILSEEEEIYVYRILALVDFRVTDGLVDVRLFAVIASLAQKIAAMDDFMRSLVTDMDFRSLEARLFKVKRLFLFLLEEQRADSGGRRGFISAEQLLLELKAGGVRPEREAAIARELRNLPPLDLLDFLAYLPLFTLIHASVVADPLDDASQL
ncbi:uncharacterized protein LOC133472104 isoform X2 [Phyllopteryx taeniolatus]|uniref:uncharacterized protein LOC133472104 isoform X2 n=1 Tax=Phyllopteryx taeniolatus TaxID=161469 RepID=UPI002AD46D84|nr:uncharacterized protein LOC133472104 isoform X2 [Phyllopteryx taeniolatus]